MGSPATALMCAFFCSIPLLIVGGVLLGLFSKMGENLGPYNDLVSTWELGFTTDFLPQVQELAGLTWASTPSLSTPFAVDQTREALDFSSNIKVAKPYSQVARVTGIYSMNLTTSNTRIPFDISYSQSSQSARSLLGVSNAQLPLVWSAVIKKKSEASCPSNTWRISSTSCGAMMGLDSICLVVQKDGVNGRWSVVEGCSLMTSLMSTALSGIGGGWPAGTNLPLAAPNSAANNYMFSYSGMSPSSSTSPPSQPMLNKPVTVTLRLSSDPFVSGVRFFGKTTLLIDPITLSKVGLGLLITAGVSLAAGLLGIIIVVTASKCSSCLEGLRSSRQSDSRRRSLELASSAGSGSSEPAAVEINILADAADAAEAGKGTIADTAAAAAAAAAAGAGSSGSQAAGEDSSDDEGSSSAAAAGAGEGKEGEGKEQEEGPHDGSSVASAFEGVIESLEEASTEPALLTIFLDAEQALQFAEDETDAVAAAVIVEELQSFKRQLQPLALKRKAALGPAIWTDNVAHGYGKALKVLQATLAKAQKKAATAGEGGAAGGAAGQAQASDDPAPQPAAKATAV